MADFADPTLLLVGDALAFHWLAGNIEARKNIQFSEVPTLVSQVSVKVQVISTDEVGSLERTANTFDWKISVDEARIFAEQLRELAAAPESAHIYLDPKKNTTQVQIVASKGEYDAAKVLTL